MDSAWIYAPLTLLLAACATTPQDETEVANSALATCGTLTATGVTASSNDGNVPANAVDGSLATRWSALGAGQFITLDLGAAKTVCGLGIAWYQGSSRSARFTIGVSTDGHAFTTVFTGHSSGTTTAVESYDFADTTARFVRVTVNGNTVNDWASITELRVSGGAVSSGPGGETLFGTTTPPAADQRADDAAAVEVGVVLQARVAGTVDAVRFFRAAANPAGYTVHLWSANGTLLGTAHGTDAGLPGWQVVPLATPVSIAANTRFVASYFSSNGDYAATDAGFASARTSNDLTAPAQAGVYHYGPSAYPTSVYHASNYWVDVQFDASSTTPPPPAGDTTAPTVSITSPTAGTAVSGTVTVRGAAADNVALSRVEVQVDSGAFQPASGTTAWTFALDAASWSSGDHTLTARATDTSGNTRTASVTVAKATTTPPSTGFPSASNTGIPAGTVITQHLGSMNLDTPGQVIQNAEIDGCVTLGSHASNVTFRNVLFKSNGCFWLLLNDAGATNLQVIDSEFDGLGNASGDAAVGGGNYTLTRVNVHGTVDGLKIGDNSTVQDSYIHDLVISAESHNDGIQALSAVNVHILRNTIVPAQGATSAIIMSENSSDGWVMRDIFIDGNLLGGGAYTVYGGYEAGTDDPSIASNINITNNRFTTRFYPRSGAFGPLTSTDAPVVRTSGNTWYDGPNAGMPVD